jgi:hypothetical protein
MAGPEHTTYAQEAQRALEAGDYLGAFANHLACATDETMPNADRAKHWAAMGSLTRPNPALCLGPNDTGLFYYEKALVLDSECLDAWFGIAHEYGTSGPWHRDRVRYIEAVRVLLQRQSELPEWQLNELKNCLSEHPL